MKALGILGLMAGIILMMVMTYRGHHVLITSLLGGMVIILTNNIPIWETLTEGYMTSMSGFVSSFLLMFLLGAIFGELMSRSGAARSIAYKLTNVFGADKAILILVLVSLILSYGGVSVFVIIFSVYQIALFLFKEADITKNIIPATVLLGAGTFSMTTLPGSPALTNVIPTTYLDTTTTSAPVIGIICSVVMFTLGYLYLTRTAKRMRENGQGFIAGENDVIEEMTEEEEAKLPGFIMSVLPIVIIFITIIIGSMREMNSNASVCLGLFFGVIYSLLVFKIDITEIKQMLFDGSTGSINALMNTASVVGFGGIVRMAPAFQVFVDFASELPFSPMINTVIAINIIAGITGSSSGGLTIFFDTMADTFLLPGMNIEVFHRISSMAAGCLDSLPHAGPNVTMLNVTGLTYEQGYKHMFVITCIVPITAVVVALILSSIGIV